MDKICFECGRPATIEHHVVPRCLGGRKKVPLCDGCHRKIHSPASALSSRVLQSGVRMPHIKDIDMWMNLWRNRKELTVRAGADLTGGRTTAQTVAEFWRGEGAAYRWLVAIKRIKPLQ